jgi:prepilin-type processing-associated H-X9-DG protein
MRTGHRHARAVARREGFTLIEILLVAAVIVMLIGMLAPATAMVRERGRATFCLNSIGQYSKAMTAYTSENNDYFSPLASLKPPEHPGHRKQYAEYIFPGFDDYVGTTKDAGKSKILQCPTWLLSGDAFLPSGTVKNETTGANESGYYLYSYNYNTYLGSSGTNPKKVTRVRRPAATILFGEPGYYFATTKQIGGSVMMFGPWRNHTGAATSGVGTQYLRHLGGKATNIAWVDGHADTVHREGGGVITLRAVSPYTKMQYVSGTGGDKDERIVTIAESGITDYQNHGDDLYDLD